MSDLEWVQRGGVGGWEAEASGGGGVALRGPYTVNFDDAGITVSPGVAFLPLTVGQWLMEAWVQVTTLFQGPGVSVVTLELGTNGADPGNNTAIADFEVGQTQEEDIFDLEQVASALSGHPLATPLTATRQEAAAIRVLPARVAIACDLCATVAPDVDALTAGTAVIWVLVGTASP